MRPIWSGNISFGLVNIPVKVCGAVEPNQVSFNQVHEPCKARIKYQKYCPQCEKEVPNYEIIKGYQSPGGIISITDEDLSQVTLPSIKTVELAGFIKEKEVDALFYQKPYYLVPDKSASAYWLLYNALKKSGKVGIARFAIHSKEHLALVRPTKGILTLCTLYYPEEIREVEGVLPSKPEPRQLELAMSLIEQQTIPFEPAEYKDRYKEAIEQMLAGKRPESAPVTSGNVMDLMEALRLSVEKSKKEKKKSSA